MAMLAGRGGDSRVQSEVSGRSRLYAALPVLVPVVAGALLTTMVLASARGAARSDTDAAVRALVAEAVSPLSAAIRSQVDQAARSAGASETVTPARAGEFEGFQSLIEARDSGVPTLQDQASPASIVVPVYSSAQPPPSTQARREAITEYRIVALALDPVLAGLTTEGGGLAVRGPSGGVVVATEPPPSGGRSFAAALDLGAAAGWVVQGWLPDPGTPSGTWVWLTGLLIACAGLAVAASYLQRSSTATRAREDRLERDVALVAGLAPVVQASLDLGEVIPAASAHLRDGLNLAGLSLSIYGDAGERPVFTWGVAPDIEVTPASVSATHLEPGETFVVVLARGGRLLGTLRVVAGARLHESDIRALGTASELLGSALANAQAFDRQQVAMEGMQALDELKTVFLATASHELRTPVTAIVGFSSLALEELRSGDADAAATFLEPVLANAHSLQTLIEQLLDFSRLERGIMPSGLEVLDLARTTSDLLGERAELTAQHRLVLELTPGCRVRGSAAALARIVTNLVGNAAKYSPAGSTITVTVRSTGPSWVELIVDDEGPGVAETERDRVFSRFYRGSGPEVVRTSGTGVGLAIVAEFAASLGATAQVLSAPTGGARFVVTFPSVSTLVSNHYEGASDVQHA